MNERIQALWNEAAKSTAAFPSGQNNSWETQVNFMDKFAELIIRECAAWVNDNLGLVDEEARKDLFKYFGVRE